MVVKGMKNIKVDWEYFNSCNDFIKAKAIQNLLATIDISSCSIENILLSLHASRMIEIEFEEEDSWEEWCERLNETFKE